MVVENPVNQIKQSYVRAFFMCVPQVIKDMNEVRKHKKINKQ